VEKVRLFPSELVSAFEFVTRTFADGLGGFSEFVSLYDKPPSLDRIPYGLTTLSEKGKYTSSNIDEPVRSLYAETIADGLVYCCVYYTASLRGLYVYSTRGAHANGTP
jgi:hypothetical protein